METFLRLYVRLLIFLIIIMNFEGAYADIGNDIAEAGVNLIGDGATGLISTGVQAGTDTGDVIGNVGSLVGTAAGGAVKTTGDIITLDPIGAGEVVSDTGVSLGNEVVLLIGNMLNIVINIILNLLNLPPFRLVDLTVSIYSYIGVGMHSIVNFIQSIETLSNSAGAVQNIM